MGINKPKKTQRDMQTVSLFLILGVLTVVALLAVRWVLIVPTGPLAPSAVEATKAP
jgi:hypothetical protein